MVEGSQLRIMGPEKSALLVLLLVLATSISGCMNSTSTSTITLYGWELIYDGYVNKSRYLPSLNEDGLTPSDFEILTPGGWIPLSAYTFVEPKMSPWEAEKFLANRTVKIWRTAWTEKIRIEEIP